MPDRSAQWVPVDEEPHHVELFGHDRVRVYEARIAPGEVTLHHRHAIDTVYVVAAGGRFRSELPYRQRSATALGRSVGVAARAGLLVRRLLTGWLVLPSGAVLWQPHGRYPLVHRIRAAAANATTIRMVGIELRGTPGAAESATTTSTATSAARAAVRTLPHTRSELRNDEVSCLRLDLEPAAATSLDAVDGAVLVVIHGRAVTGPAGDPISVSAWLPARCELRNPGPGPLRAVLVIPGPRDAPQALG